MATSQFLVDGKVPAGSAVTSTTSETTLPPFAVNSAMQLLANQMALLNTPYQPSPIPSVAPFTETERLGQGMTKTAAGAYQPGLNAAMGTVGAAAAGPGALTAANPYFQAGANTSVSNIGAYMNPYTENVVSRIAELGGRNLSENIMPAIEGRYIGAGQLGGPTRGGGLSAAPSGMLTDTARAVRDTNADIVGKQYEALNSGYSGALTAAGNDLNRLASIGSNVAGAASAEMRDRTAAGSEMANLAALYQSLGLTGANAVTGVGEAERNMNQRNLEAAEADRLRQLGHPQEQIDAAVATLRNILPAVPTRVSKEGIEPNSVPTTSTMQDIGSGLLGGAAFLQKAREMGYSF
jgi:hypothetical protein